MAACLEQYEAAQPPSPEPEAVTELPASTSAAATVVTLVVFSTTLRLAVLPPPLLLMAGGSLPASSTSSPRGPRHSFPAMSPQMSRISVICRWTKFCASYVREASPL